MLDYYDRVRDVPMMNIYCNGLYSRAIQIIRRIWKKIGFKLIWQQSDVSTDVCWAMKEIILTLELKLKAQDIKTKLLLYKIIRQN